MAQAQDNQITAGLKDRISVVLEQTGVPALAAMVSVDGEVRVRAAMGVRALGSGIPVTEKDRWHLGSISKSMTATLVARMVERGVVSWDDTVGEILGDFLPDMRAAYRQATFRHLLSHRAGLQKDLPDTQFSMFGQHPADPIADRREFARLALMQEPLGALAQTFSYSNNGAVIAAAMLEARTGKSWEKLIEDEVFVPLGLKSAGLGPPGRAGTYEQPRGHIYDAGNFRPVGVDFDNPAAMSPAARVHMSLADLLRYTDSHRRRDENFLSAANFDILHTPPFGGDYAMGWFRLTEGTTYWHNGSNGTWYAIVSFWPESKAVGVVAANGNDNSGASPPLDQLLYDLLSTAN